MPLVLSVLMRDTQQRILDSLGTQMGPEMAQMMVDVVRNNPHAYLKTTNPELAELSHAYLELESELPADVPLALVSSATRKRDRSHKIDDAFGQCPFFNTQFDNSMSGFATGSAFELVARMLFSLMMSRPKHNPCNPTDPDHPDHNDPAYYSANLPSYAMGRVDLTPPDDPELFTFVSLSGAPQLTKTPEEQVAAWTSFFVHGCVPVICVRNGGGRATGAVDMARGTDSVNAYIVSLLEELDQKELLPSSFSMDRDPRHVTLLPRNSAEGDHLTFVSSGRNAGRLTEPQVLITLCNAIQLRHLLATKRPTAHASLADIFMGQSPAHPYTCKRADPTIPANKGANRPTIRMVVIFDESDLTRTQQAGALHERMHRLRAADRQRLDRGLGSPVDLAESDSGSDWDDEGEQQAAPPSEEDEEYAQFMQALRSTKCSATGLCAALWGVIGVSATPVANSHELGCNASQAAHQVIQLVPPPNYVGLFFFSAAHCLRQVEVVIVPGRRAVRQLNKTALYEQVFTDGNLWQAGHNPPNGFVKTKGPRYQIRAIKNQCDDDPYATKLRDIVDRAFKDRLKTARPIDDDRSGLNDMLESMEKVDLAADGTAIERRALVMTNQTVTEAQKLSLLHRLVQHDACPTGATSLTTHTENFFVANFHHQYIELGWRGDAVTPELVHECLEGTNLEATAISIAASAPANCYALRLTPPNINMVYVVLQQVADKVREKTPAFPLRSVVLAGVIGGRGLSYKPSGHALGAYSHKGYLTDMFYIFTTSRTAAIGKHSEAILQEVGRLSTIVTKGMLAQMETVPPRLWTSGECWAYIETSGEALAQYVRAWSDQQPGESVGQAVARTIAANPDNNEALHRQLAVNTDAGPSKKRCFLAMTRNHRDDEQTRRTAIKGVPARVNPIGYARPAVPLVQEQLSSSLREAAQAIKDEQALLLPVTVQIRNLDELLGYMSTVTLAAAGITSEVTRNKYKSIARQMRAWGVITSLADLTVFNSPSKLMDTPEFLNNCTSVSPVAYARDASCALNFCNRVLTISNK
jgi:hypothetical protein